MPTTTSRGALSIRVIHFQVLKRNKNKTPRFDFNSVSAGEFVDIEANKAFVDDSKSLHHGSLREQPERVHRKNRSDYRCPFASSSI